MTARHLIAGLAARKVKASLSEGGGARGAAAAAAASGGGAVETAATSTSTSTTPVLFSRSARSFFARSPSFSSLRFSFRRAAWDPSTGHRPTM